MSKKRSINKKTVFMYFILSFCIMCFASIIYCNHKIEKETLGLTSYNSADIPFNRVGLLLGTSKYMDNGQLNLYYTNRINAVVNLFHAGKIKYLVISGDNGNKEYNEPEMMKQDIMAQGIDSSLLYLDYAGFRTFDSVIRMKEIFSQDSITVISQKFHNERAIFIAKKESMYAIGFNAIDVTKRFGFKTLLREKFARVKVFIDYLLGTNPKFLGAKIQIPE